MVIEKAKVDETTREQVNARLKRLGQKVIEFDEKQNAMQLQINEVKARYAGELEGRAETIRRLTQELRLAVEDSREKLLPKTRKSLSLLFGKVGFRMQGENVETAPGVTEERAALNLQSRHLPQFIRISMKPDKNALKAALKAGEISRQILKQIGLVVVPAGEDFYYEIDRPQIKEHWDE